MISQRVETSPGLGTDNFSFIRMAQAAYFICSNPVININLKMKCTAEALKNNNRKALQHIVIYFSASL